MIKRRVCSHLSQLSGTAVACSPSRSLGLRISHNSISHSSINISLSRTFQRHCSSCNDSSSNTSTSTNTNTSKDSPANSRLDHPDFSTMSGEEVSQYIKKSHQRVFDHNAKWAAEKSAQDPDFFTKLSAGQAPEYLWIGCSDSRIPAEQITGLEPGEAFVHRNIANLVCNVDLNATSVINYAVDHLQVKHIVVCGHYGCGGVKAAMTPKDLGILNPWLRNIRDVYRLYEAELDAIKCDEDRYDRLVELNVIEQCRNVMKTAAVQTSYANKGFPIVHGWVFGFKDGKLKDLNFDFSSTLENIQKIYNLTS